MEGSLVAYKVFTNGSTLQASEVNENLMQQAVATFSNAAARTAAITSPIEGQLTYLLDVDRYEHWNGSSWVSPFGATLTASATLSGSSFMISNCFSAQYTNYLVKARVGMTSADRLVIKFAAGGSALGSSIYRVNWQEGSTGRTVLGSNATGDFVFVDTGLTTGQIYNFNFEVFAPFTSNTTHGLINGVITNSVSPTVGRPYAFNGVGIYDATTSIDGIQFSAFSGTLSGNVQVYGLRN
jgi:hypothetical protein